VAMPDFDDVVITGLMASGKSTTARRLAERLGWAWRDSDAAIQADTGKTVRELRDIEGIERMHEREHAALLDALSDPAHTVISAAASVIDDPACREAMANPKVAVVWLHGDPEVLAARFASRDDHRPSYGESVAAFLAEQAARREPMVPTIGAHVVDVDNLTRGEVFERVVAALGLADDVVPMT
jgi:shikimate kinase